MKNMSKGTKILLYGIASFIGFFVIILLIGIVTNKKGNDLSGDTFSITLTSKKKTDYQWRYTISNDVVRFSKLKDNNSNNEVSDGEAFEDTYIFETIKSGEAEIKFEYKSIKDNDVADSTRYLIVVDDKLHANVKLINEDDERAKIKKYYSMTDINGEVFYELAIGTRAIELHDKENSFLDGMYLNEKYFIFNTKDKDNYLAILLEQNNNLMKIAKTNRPIYRLENSKYYYKEGCLIKNTCWNSDGSINEEEYTLNALSSTMYLDGIERATLDGAYLGGDSYEYIGTYTEKDNIVTFTGRDSYHKKNITKKFIKIEEMLIDITEDFEWLKYRVTEVEKEDLQIIK